MTLVKVKALRGFVNHDGKIVPPGEEVVVPKSFGRQVVQAMQAEFIGEMPKLKQQEAAPLETQDASPLDTQVPGGGAKLKTK